MLRICSKRPGSGKSTSSGGQPRLRASQMNWTSSRGGCLGPQQRDGGSSVRTMIEPSEAEASEAGPAEAEPAKAEPAEAEPSPPAQFIGWLTDVIASDPSTRAKLNARRGPGGREK